MGPDLTLLFSLSLPSSPWVGRSLAFLPLASRSPQSKVKRTSRAWPLCPWQWLNVQEKRKRSVCEAVNRDILDDDGDRNIYSAGINITETTFRCPVSSLMQISLTRMVFSLPAEMASTKRVDLFSLNRERHFCDTWEIQSHR